METDSGVDQSKGVWAVTVQFSPSCYISTEFCQADSDSHTVDKMMICRTISSIITDLYMIYCTHVTQSNCLRSFDQYVLPKTIYRTSIALIKIYICINCFYSVLSIKESRFSIKISTKTFFTVKSS